MAGIAYLLPGQGAQAVGMGKAFYDHSPEAREIYKRANAHLGFDLTAICFEGPQDQLTKTEICQPALFVTSLAAVEAFRTAFPNLTPVGCAGLSLGELTALAVAGVFSLTDGLYLVQARAAAMAECAAHHPGAMLAVIGLTRDALEPICRQSDTVMANVNAPDQIVLSGTVPAIEQAEALVKAQGAKRAMRLEVSGAFHSPLMQPAAERFREALAKVKLAAPRYPVISNVTAQPVRDPDMIRELLVKQIVSSVLWEPSMRWLIQEGATTCVEFPPARVLTGLLRRIDGAVKGIALNEPADCSKLEPLNA
jgi:[acyl-carrier-protein] S-malonyltransferase